MDCLYCPRKPHSYGLCTLHYSRWRDRVPMEAPYKAQTKQRKKTISFHGYERVSIDKNKRVLVHRYVMEQHLGKKLTKDEHIHHKNGNKLDNRLENLQIVSQLEHNLVHKRKFIYCPTCGSAQFKKEQC